MASTATKADQFSFGCIQLDTEEAERGYHRRNAPGQVQRPDIVDDICQDLSLQVRIDRIVHGFEREGRNPATLVVFGFRFHGINKDRRFKQARITVLFQDEKRRNGCDPEPIALWPNGDFALGEATPIEVESSYGFDAGANAGVAQGGGQANWKWEQRLSYTKSDRASLTGSIVLDMGVRKYGPNNAIRLTMNENPTTASGLVTDFRAAVLLRRINDMDRFVAHVKIKAKGNFFYNAVRGLRDLSGNSPPNDPVIFMPGIQYLRPPTLEHMLEARLAQDIDGDNLDATQLKDLAAVLGSTLLTTSVE